MPLPATLDGITAPAQLSASPRVAIVTGGSRGIGRQAVRGWLPTGTPSWSAMPATRTRPKPQ